MIRRGCEGQKSAIAREGRHSAAKGNMEEQRNVRGRSGWLLAIVSAILISMGIQFMWYRAASASFGLEVLSFVCLME